MINLNTLSTGQTLYCSQINECCEGWTSTSFHKTKVVSVERNANGSTIKFNNDVSPLYIDNNGRDIYNTHIFFKTKKEILDYISSQILI